MKRALLCLLAISGMASADTIRGTGTITSIEPGVTTVSAGDTFEFYVNFYIWDASNAYMMWTPFATTAEFGFNGSLFTDLGPSLFGHRGSDGITYSNGLSINEPLVDYSDGFGIALNGDLSVASAYNSGGLFTFWINSSDQMFRAGQDGGFAFGTIDSVTYTQTPEPSTFLLSAPMLLGLWGYRRIRSSRAARIHL